MHHTVDLRLQRWKAQLGDNVKLRMDIILVMGKTQQELETYMFGTVYALHTNPWRLEIDFWRSFINVA